MNTAQAERIEQTQNVTINFRLTDTVKSFKVDTQVSITNTLGKDNSNIIAWQNLATLSLSSLTLLNGFSKTAKVFDGGHERSLMKAIKGL